MHIYLPACQCLERLRRLNTTFPDRCCGITKYMFLNLYDSCWGLERSQDRLGVGKASSRARIESRRTA